MKKILLILPIAAASLILSGCSFYGNTPTKTPAATSSSTTSQTPPAASSNTINIQNFAFSPEALTIKKGTTVTWTNADSAPHQIKSTIFNSNMLSKGQSFSFTFNEVGTFNYNCSIHPSMTGKIIVQ